MKEVNKNRKDEILSHHTEVNIDEIWTAIEPQLDLINAEKKRKRRFLIFFIFGAMMLASTGFYMWQNGYSQLETITNEIEVENTNEVESKNGETLIKETTKQLSEVRTDEPLIIQNADKQSVKNTKVAIKNEVAQSKISSSISTKSTTVSNKNEVAKVKDTTTSNANYKNHPLSNKDDIFNKPTDTKEETSLDEEVTLAEAATGVTKGDTANTEAPTSLTPNPQTSTNKPQLPNTMTDSDENIVVKENEDIAKEVDDKSDSNEEENEDELPGGKLSFALSANTGISFINRGLASNIPGENSPEVLRLRRASETLLEAIHYDLRAKVTHKSGLSLSTGAQYTVLSERYNNNNTTMDSDSIEGIVKRIIQINGDTVDMPGMIPRTTTYDYEKEIYNRYKMIDIPFIVGFEGGMKEWGLGIQAGVFVNLALNTSGQIRSTATQDLDIGSNQADVFKNKVGLSYYGGIYVRRALSQNLDVTIAPHGRFFAQDFNVSSYELKQRYSLIGIQAGLSYRFGY